jgi:hypothetical protein
MVSTEDAGSTIIAGGMLIDDIIDYGTLIGMQGVRTSVYINGYYRTSSTAMAFGIFGGNMVVDGKKAGRSWVKGNTLFWNSLPVELQKSTGLPESGSLVFNTQGSKGVDKGAGLQAYRLNAAAAIASIQLYAKEYANFNQALKGWNTALDGTSPTITGLLLMTPYKYDPTSKTYYDAVQQEVTDALGQIMNANIDPAMWKLLFPSQQQPVLDGPLKIIADSPVPGVADPKLWYQQLSSAVLTQGMANGDNPNCKNMNGPRAAAWLSTEVSTSKVYYTHGQELFHMKWLEANPTFQVYLDDQRDNYDGYNVIIDEKVSETIDEINETVITDKNSPPDMIDEMIADAMEAGEYAKENKLYWAYAFYTYNTMPAVLNNIAIELSSTAGNHDASVLTRNFQVVSTVLTALDPSGFFARQYNTAIDVFMCSNIMMTMYGFTGEDGTFSLIGEYLNQFVNDNIDNEDAAIAQAAAQLQEMIQSENFPTKLGETIDAMQAFAETIDAAMAYPYVMQKLVTWFKNANPVWADRAELFCGVVTTGIMGMSIYNLYFNFSNWDKLSTEQRAQIITDTVQLGIQVVGGIVKRGVRAYAVFTSEGMGLTEGFGAVWKVMLLGKPGVGSTALLDDSVASLGSGFAKWLGGTEGSFSLMLAEDAIPESTPLLVDSIESAQEISWMYKVFGRNLDEFISTRLGPVFIIAGMGYSIWLIVNGDAGLALASDILNLVAGGLMLLASAGAMIAEGVLATILSCAGPLAIIVALAGVALMIYEIYHKKPDPVEQFVNTYCKPAGFYVPSKCTAIDYAVAYSDSTKNDLTMLGFTLGSAGKCLRLTESGVIELGDNNNMPEFVWSSKTDGQGMTQIGAFTMPPGADKVICFYLSLMSDNTICFRQAISVKGAPPNDGQDDPSVVTQTWYSNTVGNATLSGDGDYLQSLQLNLQPVIPKDGNYDPSNARGYIRQTDSTVVYDQNNATLFTLTMAAVAPNYMTMVNLTFYVNSLPNQYQTWAPAFGIYPSKPVTWWNEGDLPGFLGFDTQTGIYSPINRVKVSSTYNSTNTINVQNPVGVGSADFSIAAVDPRKVPSPDGVLTS